MKTIEEKAKAYDEAIKKAESLYKAAEPMSGCNVIIETLFPELKESEDEKVRKKLINLVKKSYEQGGFALHKWEADEMLTWLDKQGEKHQNPYNGISFEYNGHIWGMCARDNGVDISCDKHLIKHLEKQGEQKPAEWSEEDEQHIDSLLKRLDSLCRNKFERTRFAISEDKEWLKSLRPLKRWKPNEDDIIILEKLIKGELEPKVYQATLFNVLEQLKKLKEGKV